VWTYDLTHVQDDDSTLESDTKTCNQTTGDDESKTIDGHLQDNTDDVDETTEHDGIPTTQDVGHISSNNGAKEGTRGEDGSDERLSRSRQYWGRPSLTGDQANELGRGQYTVDVTTVISKEDT